MPDMRRSVLIIEARFYDDIADELARGAIAELERQAMAYARVSVPGALEIPVAMAIAISNGHLGPGATHCGCIALGCVIRGETSHYDIVAGQSSQRILALATDHAVPLGNGILTVDNRDQAWTRARADDDGRNKGRDAAAACLGLVALQTGELAGLNR